MAPNSAERLQHLFLDAEEPKCLFSTSTVQTALDEPLRNHHTHTTHTKPAIIRYPSNASTASSASSYSCSNHSWDRKDSMGRRSSVSSAATSISVPPWQDPTLDQHLARQPHVYGYDLACEFFFVGCEMRFHPVEFEEWISHSASHLGNTLPQTVICTFCDNDEAVFHSNGNNVSNWRDRMVHIGAHLENFTPSERMRPDYWVIEHMLENKLISREDYNDTLEGSERPYCANLVDDQFETPRMMKRNASNVQQRHDLENEKRRMDRGSKKGTSSIPRPSHAYRKSYNPRVEKER